MELVGAGVEGAGLRGAQGWEPSLSKKIKKMMGRESSRAKFKSWLHHLMTL